MADSRWPTTPENYDPATDPGDPFAREGGMPLAYRAQQAGTAAALLSALGLAGSTQRNE